jgi:hypothetical protein
MIEQVFNPGWGAQTVVANATSATAAVDLPATCREIALTNTSGTAITYVYVTPYEGVTVPTGVAPTAANGFPILPGQQIRIGVGIGRKVIRTIASAADGSIIISPGNGG